MSAYNRYGFTKEVYSNYIILLKRKNRYYSYSMDRKVLDYIKFKDKTYILRRKHINYLILDELDIVEKYEYSDNQLDKYIYLVYMKKVLDEIKVVISLKYDLL